MKKKKRNFTTLILVVILLAGLSLLLYPTVSDYWNSLHASQVISDYAEQVSDLDNDRYAEMWENARAFNEELLERTNTYMLTEEQAARYDELLNLTSTGIMGYIEIPNIKCSIPIYHGTEDSVLQIAIGHLDWTSLPTGGENTHCVLSGHRGLPSAKLFSDLDKVIVGDIFILRILDEVLTYEVDQILIVEPHETAALRVENGKDLCTLVTCTPYGVNSHRLLVRGHRIENLKTSTIRLTSEAIQIEPMIVAPVVALPILLVLLIALLWPHKTKKRYWEEDDDV